MSEATAIFRQFQNAKRAEASASGQEVAFCIAGWVSYHTLSGALMERHGDMLQATGCWQGWIEYDGVKIYPSRSIETGFYCCHLDPRP